MDDELRRWQGPAHKTVNTPAQVELRAREQAAAVEEAREAMEVEIQPAIHQSHLRGSAQAPLLFGA